MAVTVSVAEAWLSGYVAHAIPFPRAAKASPAQSVTTAGQDAAPRGATALIVDVDVRCRGRWVEVEGADVGLVADAGRTAPARDAASCDPARDAGSPDPAGGAHSSGPVVDAGSPDPAHHTSSRRPAADVGSAGPAVAEPDPAIGVLVGAARTRARVEAQLLDAVAGVVAVCRQVLLVRHGLVDPGDPGQDPDGDAGEAWQALSGGDRRQIEDDTRRRATTEVATALGVKPWEARLMVGLVMAGDRVTSLVTAALERGETCWPQLRRFWELAGSRARQLTADQQELVAQALFGTDPGLAAEERFDPDGQLALGLPWSQERFEGAVEREVKACEGVDVVAERERRNRARAARRCSVRVHDDGTATFSVRAPLYKVLAAHDRHDNIARTLRAAGHPDSIAALAADSAIATLSHGILDVPASQIDELSEADLEDLVAVVNGHPRITLQVIVPADVLGLGHAVCVTCASELDPTPGPNPPPNPAPAPAPSRRRGRCSRHRRF